MLRMRDRRTRRLVDRRQAHLGHEPPDPFASDRITLTAQTAGHLARAIPRRFQELGVKQPHQFQVQRSLARWLIVEDPAVVESYRMSGDTDYLLKFDVTDISALNLVYQKLI